MSFSEVTVIKVVGQDAALFTQRCQQYQQARSPSSPHEFSNEDWPPQARREMEHTLAGLLRKWKSPSVVFGAKFMDNDSVGGSQLHVVRWAMGEAYGVDVPILATDKYVALYFLSSTKVKTALKLSARKNAVRKQSSERRLCFLLIDACLAGEWSEQPGIVLAVDQALGPTRRNWGDT